MQINLDDLTKHRLFIFKLNEGFSATHPNLISWQAINNKYVYATLEQRDLWCWFKWARRLVFLQAVFCRAAAASATRKYKHCRHALLKQRALVSDERQIASTRVHYWYLYFGQWYFITLACWNKVSIVKLKIITLSLLPQVNSSFFLVDSKQFLFHLGLLFNWRANLKKKEFLHFNRLSNDSELFTKFQKKIHQ